MYEELQNALDWEERISTMAREYGQSITSRRPIYLFGPSYLTYLFSPQARRLEAELRHYGHTHQAGLPAGWKTGWPGRDQERLYFLLEELSSQSPALKRETILENTRAGIFHWSAGPLEVDLIVPQPRYVRWMDPRLSSLDAMSSLVLARIGSRTEPTVIRSMNLAQSIQATTKAISHVEKALGREHGSSEVTHEIEPPIAEPKEAPPRRDAWIKA